MPTWATVTLPGGAAAGRGRGRRVPVPCPPAEVVVVAVGAPPAPRRAARIPLPPPLFPLFWVEAPRVSACTLLFFVAPVAAPPFPSPFF